MSDWKWTTLAYGGAFAGFVGGMALSETLELGFAATALAAFVIGIAGMFALVMLWPDRHLDP